MLRAQNQGCAVAASKNPFIPAVALIVWCASVQAQWPLNHSSDVPRTADGEVDLNAAAPRTADGKPDLSGVWRAGPGTYARGQPTGLSYAGPDVAHATSFLIAPFGILQRTDYGEALFTARQAADSRDNPRSHCLPMGIIQLHTSALPARYVRPRGSLSSSTNGIWNGATFSSTAVRVRARTRSRGGTATPSGGGK